MSGNFLSSDELARAGFGHVGANARISRQALFLAPERIHIGDDVRIDAFCILSGGHPGLHIGATFTSRLILRSSAALPSMSGTSPRFLCAARSSARTTTTPGRR